MVEDNLDVKGLVDAICIDKDGKPKAIIFKTKIVEKEPYSQVYMYAQALGRLQRKEE